MRNMDDIMELTNFEGVEISMEESIGNKYVLDVSSQKAEQALAPMVEAGVKFLHDKGFSDLDIQEMLVENNADEASLACLALAVSTVEYIGDKYGEARDDLEINWSLVAHCALQAIGVDFLYAAGTSTSKAWTMAAIKTVFKNVATKMVGPVGAIIALGYFSYCYYKGA